MRKIKKDKRKRKRKRNESNGQREKRWMQEMKTYKRGVGQSYDSSSHFRNEYDEHDGGKLQGEKKRGMCQGFSNILIKKKLIYSRIVVKSMDSEYTGLC